MLLLRSVAPGPNRTAGSWLINVCVLGVAGPSKMLSVSLVDFVIAVSSGS